MFCAASNAIEQCKVEGVVSVYQAVKTVRNNRPEAVNTLVCEHGIYCIYTDLKSHFMQ